MLEIIFAVALIAGLGALFGGIKGARMAVGLVFSFVLVVGLCLLAWGYMQYGRPEQELADRCKKTGQLPVYDKGACVGSNAQPSGFDPDKSFTVVVPKVTAKTNHAFVKVSTKIRHLCYWNTVHSLGCFYDDSLVAVLNEGDDVLLLSDPTRTPEGKMVRKVRLQKWVGWTEEGSLSNVEPSDPWEEAAKSYNQDPYAPYRKQKENQ